MNVKKFLYLFFAAALLFALSACSNSRGYYREGSVNPPATRSFEDRVVRRNSRNNVNRLPGFDNRFATTSPPNHQRALPAAPNNSKYPVEAAPNSVLIVKPDTVPPFDQPQGAAHPATTSKPASSSTESQPLPSNQSPAPASAAPFQPTSSGKQILGSHTTEFNAKEENRVTNITKASTSINGHVVKPGETFSYNETVGPTIERRGYKKGIIFVDGEKKEGFGGGVCQVSTTLCIAADEAGMTITERHDHSLPVSYAQEGEEAATSYGVIDFKFKNEKPFPVVIHSAVKDGTITVSVSEA